MRRTTLHSPNLKLLLSIAGLLLVGGLALYISFVGIYKERDERSKAAADQDITRAEAAQLIDNSFSLSPNIPDQPSFADVPVTHPNYEAIETIFAAGITTGCAKDPLRYCPDRILNRGEAATFILRGANMATPPRERPDFYFQDVPTTHPLFAYIQRFKELGLENTCNNSPDLFCPNEPITPTDWQALVQTLFNRQGTPVKVSSDDITYHGRITGAQSWDYAPTILKENQYYMWWCGENMNATQKPILNTQSFTTQFDVIRRSQSADNQTWTAPQEVYLTPESQGYHACDPSIVKYQNTYFMYYTSDVNELGEGNANEVYLATSPNGMDWTPQNNEEAVISLPFFDQTYGVGQSSVVLKDGKFIHFYTDTTVGTNAVKVAESSDGIHFQTRNNNQPIIQGFATIDAKYDPASDTFVIAAGESPFHFRLFVLDSNYKVIKNATVPKEALPQPCNHNPGLLGDTKGHLLPDQPIQIYFGSGPKTPEGTCWTQPHWEIHALSLPKSLLIDSNLTQPSPTTTTDTPLTDAQVCQSGGGAWEQFSNSCADRCEAQTTDPAIFIACTQTVTDSCNCGPSQCWNGSACITNPSSPDGMPRAEAARRIVSDFNLSSLAPSTPSFADVPTTHPQYASIETLYRQGITQGCAIDPLRFCPDRLTTRADTAAFMLRAHGINTNPTDTAPRFADVDSDHPLFAYIQRFGELGITSGCAVDPVRFCPDRPVTDFEWDTFTNRILSIKQTTTLNTQYDPADINMDGSVNTTDYNLLTKDFLRRKPKNERSDINGDGVVNTLDYQLFLNSYH